MLVTADPNTAISADAIIELGSGRKSSSNTPIKGAPMTIDVSEYFPEGEEESCPNDPDDVESLHLWRNSAFSKHKGQYSATLFALVYGLCLNIRIIIGFTVFVCFW